MKRTVSESASSRSNSARGKRAAKGGYVMCVDNHDYPASLEIGKVYRKLPANGHSPAWIRVVDESGEDYLFPARRFVPVAIPSRGRAVLNMSNQE
jgi:hypothetical protein